MSNLFNETRLKNILQNLPDERVDLEYKGWLAKDTMNQKNPSSKDTKNQKVFSFKECIVRCICAMANTDGGMIIFGVDNKLNNNNTSVLKTNPPKGYKEVMTHDQFHQILNNYLVPKIECKIYMVECNSILYPIVEVAGGNSKPVLYCNKNENEKYELLIRSPKPEVVSLGSPDQWNDFINRMVKRNLSVELENFKTILNEKVIEIFINETAKSFSDTLFNHVKNYNI